MKMSFLPIALSFYDFNDKLHFELCSLQCFKTIDGKLLENGSIDKKLKRLRLNWNRTLVESFVCEESEEVRLVAGEHMKRRSCNRVHFCFKNGLQYRLTSRCPYPHVCSVITDEKRFTINGLRTFSGGRFNRDLLQK